jgi:hypothetical protein
MSDISYLVKPVDLKEVRLCDKVKCLQPNFSICYQDNYKECIFYSKEQQRKTIIAWGWEVKQ